MRVIISGLNPCRNKSKEVQKEFKELQISDFI
jgi:hypothetical protein